MLNNIDLAQVKQYEAEIKADDNEALFTTKMTGTWQFDENGPQFTADAKTDAGPVTFALTHPNFEKLGNYPSPMAYGLFWICGCASATFMTAAAKRGHRSRPRLPCTVPARNTASGWCIQSYLQRNQRTGN